MSAPEPKGQPAPDSGGMRLTLRDASGQVIGTVGSAADGVYSFNDLLNGHAPAAPLAHVTGSVYLDVNRRGHRGPGDPGYVGVTVLLTGTDAAGKAIRLTATTDADGRYAFDELAAGYYRLEVNSPIPHTQPGHNSVGTLGGQESGAALVFHIQPGQRGERYDFGRVLPQPKAEPTPAAPVPVAQPAVSTRDLFFSVLGSESFGAAAFGGTQLGTGPVTPPEPTSTLTGCVFHDRDNDGVLGAGDAGLVGVEVTLTGTTHKGTPVLLTVATGEDGSFTFPDLPPGTYALSRKHAATYVAGRALAGTVNGTTVGQAVEDGVRQIVLAGGAFGQNYRFAEVRGCGLTGMVLLEDVEDDDGPLETPLEGATLILSGADEAGRPVQQTVRTDGRGSYRFKDLYPGKYDVYAAPLPGLAAKEARPGDKGGRAAGAGKVSGVTLHSGELGSRYNFKMHGTGSLSGRVWAGPNPAANAPVTLTGQDEAGNDVSRTARTDGQGVYRFAHLRAGSYRLEAAGGAADLELGAGATATGYDLNAG